jgi:SSS family solute:Na+ symporter
MITYHSDMAQNFGGAIAAWTTAFVVTVVISLLTKRTKTDEELVGLVYSLTPKPVETEKAWYNKPAILGTLVLILALILNIIFK